MPKWDKSWNDYTDMLFLVKDDKILGTFFSVGDFIIRTTNDVLSKENVLKMKNDDGHINIGIKGNQILWLNAKDDLNEYDMKNDTFPQSEGDQLRILDKVYLFHRNGEKIKGVYETADLTFYRDKDIIFVEKIVIQHLTSEPITPAPGSGKPEPEPGKPAPAPAPAPGSGKPEPAPKKPTISKIKVDSRDPRYDTHSLITKINNASDTLTNNLTELKSSRGGGKLFGLRDDNKGFVEDQFKRMEDLVNNFVEFVDEFITYPTVLKLNSLSVTQVTHLFSREKQINISIDSHRFQSTDPTEIKKIIFTFLFYPLKIDYIHTNMSMKSDVSLVFNEKINEYEKQIGKNIITTMGIYEQNNNVDLDDFGNDDGNKKIIHIKYLATIFKNIVLKLKDDIRRTEKSNTDIVNDVFYIIVDHIEKINDAFKAPHELTFNGSKKSTELLNIIKSLETNNDPFMKEFNKYVTENVSDKILTYVKINNFEHGKGNGGRSVWNKRFNILLNSITNLQPRHNAMVVKYNDIDSQYNENSGYTKKYLFGKFSQIFPPNMDNSAIGAEMTQIVEKVKSGKPVFIMGYGASGSGKTSSLIYFSDGAEGQKEGIIVDICKKICQGENAFAKIVLKTEEIFQNNESPNAAYQECDSEEGQITNCKSIEYTFNFHDNDFEKEEKETVTVNGIVEYIDNTTRIHHEYRKPGEIRNSFGEILKYLIDSDRLVKATTNNPQSSRSHSFAFIKFMKEDENRYGYLIVGDFAGVENEFSCNNIVTIHDFLNLKNDKHVLFYGGYGATNFNDDARYIIKEYCNMYTGRVQQDIDRLKKMFNEYFPDSIDNHGTLNNRKITNIKKIKECLIANKSEFYNPVFYNNFKKKIDNIYEYIKNEEATADDEQRLADAEAKRIADEEQSKSAEEAERRRQEEERRRQEEERRRQEEERRRQAEAERQRQAEAERQRQAEAERQRQAEAERQRQSEEKRIAEAKIAEAKTAEEKRIAEDAQRLAEAKAAEEKRQSDEAKAAAEAEAKRLAEEKRIADAEAKRIAEEEAKRIADAKAEAERQRQADAKAAEAAAEAERQRLAAEAERQRLADAEAKRIAAEAAVEAERQRLAEEEKSAAALAAATAATLKEEERKLKEEERKLKDIKKQLDKERQNENNKKNISKQQRAENAAKISAKNATNEKEIDNNAKKIERLNKEKERLKRNEAERIAKTIAEEKENYRKNLLDLSNKEINEQYIRNQINAIYEKYGAELKEQMNSQDDEALKPILYKWIDTIFDVDWLNENDLNINMEEFKQNHYFKIINLLVKSIEKCNAIDTYENAMQRIKGLDEKYPNYDKVKNNKTGLKYSSNITTWNDKLANYKNERFINNDDFDIGPITLKDDKLFNEYMKNIIKTTEYKNDLDKILINHPFTNVYMKVKKPNSSIFNIENAILGDIVTVLTNFKNRLTHGQEICNHRLYEGKFINKSLQEMREDIKNIFYEKQKDNIFISPDYVNLCLEKYCPTHSDCFNQDIPPNGQPIKSVIFNKIFNYLKTNNYFSEEQPQELQPKFYQDILVSVFCVFNISPDANNPPPVPYIDINELKIALKKIEKQDMDAKNELIQNLKKIYYKINPKLFENENENENTFDQSKTSSIQQFIFDKKNIFDTVFSILTKIEKEEDHLITDDIFYIKKFIESIDNNNAISAIGTLEFLDQISKYHTTQTICFLEEQQQIGEPDYKEIYNGEGTFLLNP